MFQSKTPNAPVDVTFQVNRAGEVKPMTYPELFLLGHELWRHAKYTEAVKVFELLTSVKDRGPRAHIFLAHCRAMLSDYASCCFVLSQGLPSNVYGHAGSDLHYAFVMWRCALYQDTKDYLKDVVLMHPELPTPCLLLADLLQRAGSKDEPERLLKEAIRRDRPDGAIALIARQELSDVTRRSTKSPSRPPVRRSHP